MSTDVNLNEIPAYTLHNQMCKLSRPLKEKYDIDFFCHRRLYDDNTLFTLNNNLELVEYFLKNDLMHLLPHSINLSDFDDGCGFLITRDRNNPSETILSAANQFFDVDSAFCITKKSQHFVDIFIFSTTAANPSMLNFYVNHTHELREFIEQYYEYGENVIKQAASSRIDVVEIGADINKYPLYKAAMDIGRMKKDSTLPQIGQRRIQDYLLQQSTSTANRRRIKVGRIELTNREADCLKWLLEGKSAQETSKILRISKRTVENHIARTKIKFDVSKKSELVVKLLEAEIFSKHFTPDTT